MEAESVGDMRAPCGTLRRRQATLPGTSVRKADYSETRGRGPLGTRRMGEAFRKGL